MNHSPSQKNKQLVEANKMHQKRVRKTRRSTREHRGVQCQYPNTDRMDSFVCKAFVMGLNVNTAGICLYDHVGPFGENCRECNCDYDCGIQYKWLIGALIKYNVYTCRLDHNGKVGERCKGCGFSFGDQ